MKNSHRSEQGQIIILFVFGLVGLLGLTALAIDGGMVYSDRRFDQSVADAAALSGAGAAAEKIASISSTEFTCSNTDVIAGMHVARGAAIQRGADNGFSGTTALLPNTSTKHGVDVVCKDGLEKYLEVRVELSSVTSTSLVHVVSGQEEVPIGVGSRVRIYAKSPVVPGAALVGLEDACDAVEYNGAITNIINGGGVFSNGGVTKNGGGTGFIDVDSIRTVDGTCGGGDGYVGAYDPLSERTKSKMSTNNDPVEIDIDPVDCSGVAEATSTSAGGVTTWTAGRHETEVTGNVVLEPGLHCLMDGFRMSGGDIIKGHGVTLVLAGGEFHTGGMGTDGYAELLAPLDDTTGTIPGIPGLLIIVNPSNPKNSIDMLGNSFSVFRGTVYNPNGQTEIGGCASAPEANYSTQIISYNVVVSGTAEVNMIYDEKYYYQQDAYIDQHK